MFEIKYEKNAEPCGTANAYDPVKRDRERTRIERDMLDFRPGARRACQLIARIDGIDGTFLFGNGAATQLAPRVHPFASRLGATQVSWGLAPVYTNY